MYRLEKTFPTVDEAVAGLTDDFDYPKDVLNNAKTERKALTVLAIKISQSRPEEIQPIFQLVANNDMVTFNNFGWYSEKVVWTAWIEFFDIVMFVPAGWKRVNE